MNRTQPDKKEDNRPKVTIELDEIYCNFLKFLFKTPSDAAEIKLRRNIDIAKLIHANVIAVDTPPDKKEYKGNVCTFILALDNVNEVALRHHHLRISCWGEQKIREAIEYEFRTWVKRCFEIGYQMKYDQKTIIEAILRGLNDRNNSVSYDAIKQYDYRTRRKVEEIRFKELLRVCEISEY